MDQTDGAKTRYLVSFNHQIDRFEKKDDELTGCCSRLSDDSRSPKPKFADTVGDKKAFAVSVVRTWGWICKRYELLELQLTLHSSTLINVSWPTGKRYCTS